MRVVIRRCFISSGGLSNVRVVSAGDPFQVQHHIANMFPTFDVPQAETVGARKARIASKDETTRRASSATSHSSGSSTRNVKASTSKPEKSGWGWGSKKSKSKEIQEISTLPPVKKSPPVQEPEPEPEPELDTEPEPSIAPSSISPSQDWSASLAIRHQDAQRRPSPRSYQSDPQYPPAQQQQQRFAPPSRSLPSVPPAGALPQPPYPGPDLTPNLRGKCIDFAFIDLQRGSIAQNLSFWEAISKDPQFSEQRSATIEAQTEAARVKRGRH